MNTIPTALDWQNDPAAALAASLDLAKKTAADADASTNVIACGIAAQVVAAAAPLAGAAIGGPTGALAAAALAQFGIGLASQHAESLASLTPDQQALVTTAIQVGVAEATAKLKKGA